MWLRTTIGMVATAARLVHPYWLAPWRSPLLRWRIETYGLADRYGRLLSASSIDRAAFFRFLSLHHRSLLRFLRWSVTLQRQGGLS